MSSVPHFEGTDGVERTLLFAFPSSEFLEDQVTLWGAKARVDAQTTEAYFELVFRINGDYLVYRLPHDMDVLMSVLKKGVGMT